MKSTTIKLSEGLRDLCQRVDEDIEKTAGERVGFSLVIYTAGRASYISNVKREDAIPELEFLLKLWKADMPDIPAHKVN